jgi:hypothetical protein
MTTYVVQEKPTGRWIAACCDEASGCWFGPAIGDYDTKPQAVAAERAHLRWHAQLEAERRRTELERLARLDKIDSWRHSENCERYATLYAKGDDNCLCGLAGWQEYARRARL